MLNNPVSVERKIGGRTLTIETGRIAKLASGACTVRYGDTIVLAATVVGKEVEQDFFPLSVDYREKTYAAGRFPGGYFKREGRPTTKETLTSRLCDRPVRPLFPEGYRTEVVVSLTALSADQENDPDILSMIATSASLALCDGLAYMGPTGSVRIGRIGGELVVNPTIKELELSDLDLVVSGLEDAIIMVEGGGKEVPEAVLLQALDLAQATIREVIALQRELMAKLGKKPFVATEAPKSDPLADEIIAKFLAPMKEANITLGKATRKAAVSKVKKAIKEAYAAKIAAGELTAEALQKGLDALERKTVRSQIIDDGIRADRRKTDDIREIEIEVGVLPRVHGSALFTRGETQALVVATLGTTRDSQRVDGLGDPVEQTFMLQYNFPGYSVNESWPNRGPKRREIGHGALAERSVERVMPEKERFPYVVRIVSEITESNGSSSMASVCGGTLALMDAGVPIKRPVAGIAMGLIMEGSRYAILSDILGGEDGQGDMDFKVAGSQLGITGFQMDVKAKCGITMTILKEALEQARKGRIHILKHMLKAIPEPRQKISKFAPRLVQVKISTEKIGAIIGPGGKNIRKIQEETRCTIELNDQTGIATIAGDANANIEEAIRRVRDAGAEVEVGKLYTGKVVSIKDFGVFVEVLPGAEGLCHVSELSSDFVKDVSSIAKLGDMITVKVLAVDGQGRIRLSRKAAEAEAQKAALVPQPA